MEKNEIGPEAFLEPVVHEDAEDVQEDTSTPETGEDDGAEAVEAEEDTAPDGEQDEPDVAEQEPELFTVKVDGQEVRVTLEELRRSYSGQAFINKGLKETADAKRQAQEVFQSLQAQHKRVLEFAQQIEAEGVIREPTPPDPAKFKNDPMGLNEAMAEYWTRNRDFQRQQAQIAQMRDQQHRAEMAAIEAHVAQERERVLEELPEFANEDYKRSLAEYAMNAGYSVDEVGALVDGRALKLLNKAMLYDRQQKAVAKARAEKLTPENRVVKSTAKRSEPPQLARGKIIAKAKASGKEADWLAAFMDKPS